MLIMSLLVKLLLLSFGRSFANFRIARYRLALVALFTVTQLGYFEGLVLAWGGVSKRFTRVVHGLLCVGLQRYLLHVNETWLFVVESCCCLVLVSRRQNLRVDQAMKTCAAAPAIRICVPQMLRFEAS